MIKITFADGITHEIINDESAITTQEEFESVFKGNAGVQYQNGMDLKDMLFDIEGLNLSDYDGEYHRIVKAEWIDTYPENSFEEYIIERMNESGDAAFSIAENGLSPIREIEIIQNYYHGFHEAVNEQINLDGIEFVIGNEFSLNNIIDLVAREIARTYLREHDLY